MESMDIRTKIGEALHRQDVRRTRRRRPWVITTALVFFVATVAAMSCGCSAPVPAAVAQAGGGGGAHKVAVFDDVTVGPGETFEYVVVVGGRATVLGTVEKSLVVVGGDVIIGGEARVGGGRGPDQGTAVVVVFGDIEVEPGATVVGGVHDVGWRFGDWLGAVSFSPDFNRWDSRTIGGWVWLTAFLAVVAVIMAAIAPRQVVHVSERVRAHVFSSLGWGALVVLVAVPLVTLAVLVLVLFLVGVFLLVPWLGIVVPVMWLFGFVTVGATLGRLILGRRGDERGPVMLAAVLGVVILSVLWWIPVAGLIILFLVSLMGVGATCVSLWGAIRRKEVGRNATSA